MNKRIAVVMLALGLALGGCASSPANKEPVSCYKAGEFQCDVTGYHTLASDVPDYLPALRGDWDGTGGRSVLLQ